MYLGKDELVKLYVEYFLSTNISSQKIVSYKKQLLISYNTVTDRPNDSMALSDTIPVSIHDVAMALVLVYEESPKSMEQILSSILLQPPVQNKRVVHHWKIQPQRSQPQNKRK